MKKKIYFSILLFLSSIFLFGQRSAVIILGVDTPQDENTPDEKPKREEEFDLVLRGLSLFPDIDTIFVVPPPGERDFKVDSPRVANVPPVITVIPRPVMEGNSFGEIYKELLNDFYSWPLREPKEKEPANPLPGIDPGGVIPPYDPEPVTIEWRFPRLAMIGSGDENGLRLSENGYLSPAELADLIIQMPEMSGSRRGIKILTNSTFRNAQMERIFELVNESDNPPVIIPFNMDIGEVRDNLIATGSAPGEVVEGGFPGWIFIPIGAVATVPLILILTDNKDPCRNDDTPPDIACPPDVTIPCEDALDIDLTGRATAVDDCDPELAVTFGENMEGGRLVRTWQALDDGGNSAACTQIITLTDNLPPTFQDVPTDASYDCPQSVPPLAPLPWTDNCDEPGTASGHETTEGDFCHQTIRREWTAVDNSGNNTSYVQIITIRDDEPPQFETPPQDMTVCWNQIPPHQPLTWTDNCDGTGQVMPSEEQTGINCPIIITRTWAYTDQCGNAASVSQTITINDEEAPQFEATPAEITICPGQIPEPQPLGWTDNCDGMGLVLPEDLQIGSGCPSTIIRTWSYTDVCGNSAAVSQAIDIRDEEAPQFVDPPGDTTLCPPHVEEYLAAFDYLTWTDNCDGTGQVISNDSIYFLDLLCPIDIFRTWIYTDQCGNTTDHMQKIAVNDEEPPQFETPPADITVCPGHIPEPQPLGWTDNCDGAGQVMPEEFQFGSSCPYEIYRDWIYFDGCGNEAFAEQVITVHDEENPQFVDPPGDTTLTCQDQLDNYLEATGHLTWTDNCDGTGQVISQDSIDGFDLFCPFVIERTWTYVDECGNAAVHVQNVTLDDLEPPQFEAPPPDIAVCAGQIPEPQPLGWTDNCDGAGQVMPEDFQIGINCLTPIIREWTYTDRCGNEGFVSQNILVTDLEAPVFESPPPAITVCNGQIPEPHPLSWTDNCDGAGQVMPTDEQNGNDCPYTITRTWSYTDQCGNSASAGQIITVGDTEAPQLETPPQDASVQCIEDIPTAQPLVWTDNCDGAGLVLPTDELAGNVCPLKLTRTWTYTDACGNSASVSQEFTVHDQEPPQLEEPPEDISVQCLDEIPPPTPLNWTDNCDGAGQVLPEDEQNGSVCPLSITRRWTYTDACGNSASVSQTITADDNEAPVATNPPADTTIICPGSCFDCPFPPVPDPGFTDDCDEFLSISFLEEFFPPFLLQRTWTATDDCGNSVTIMQRITFICIEGLEEPSPEESSSFVLYPAPFLPGPEGLAPVQPSPPDILNFLRWKDQGAMEWVTTDSYGRLFPQGRGLILSVPVKDQIELAAGFYFGKGIADFVFLDRLSGRNLGFTDSRHWLSASGALRYFPGAGGRFYLSSGLELNYLEQRIRDVRLDNQWLGTGPVYRHWDISGRAGGGLRIPWGEWGFFEVEGILYSRRSILWRGQGMLITPEAWLRLGYRFPVFNQ